MTDHTNLINDLRTHAMFDYTTIGNEAADALEYQAKLIEQFGGISKDAMEQCFALTKERDQLRAEVERLKLAAKPALAAMRDASVECQTFHHAKKDQHKIGGDCAPMTRWEVAYSQLESALSADAAPTKEQT